MNHQQMNDGRYNIYPWLRRVTTAKFFGGPLHGQFMEVQPWQDRFYIYEEEHAFVLPLDEDPGESFIPRIGVYKRIHESDIVLSRGIQPLFSFVYCGAE